MDIFLINNQNLELINILMNLPGQILVNRISGKDPTYGISLSFISVEAINKNNR